MPLKPTKTGLFFGSFNPVHNGHLAIARHLLDHEGLHEIWFIISPQNPLKEKENLADAQQRFEMMNLALSSEPRFKISDVEFTLPKPSYTFDTLELLTNTYPERAFCLIIGSDNLEEFHLWKNYREILKKYQILVYPRRKKFNNPFSAEPNVRITSAPLIEISSTNIRQLLHQNKDVSRLIPLKVMKYITAKSLYAK